MFLVHSLNKGHIHNARCAGSFLRSQCDHVAGYEAMFPRHQPTNTLYPHYEWSMIIRDPVERFISLWQHWLQLPQYRESIVLGPGGLVCQRSIMSNWHNFVAWHRDHPTQDTGDTAWSSQGHRATARTVFFRFEDEIEACVRWMGGRVTGVAINQSHALHTGITAQERAHIQQHYGPDQALWQSLQ